MPWPTSRYHWPRPAAGSTPASCHRRSSAACVPERSPRLTNAARASAIRRSASLVSRSPLTRAGSAAGPTTTKSLNITCRRGPPKPSATKRSSATRSCTNTTSASPRRPTSSAWPVPSATTRTVMPVSAVKIGRMWRNRPDCSVLVVLATVMKRSCAAGMPGRTRAAAAAARNRRRNMAGLPDGPFTTPVRRAGRPRLLVWQAG